MRVFSDGPYLPVIGDAKQAHRKAQAAFAPAIAPTFAPAFAPAIAPAFSVNAPSCAFQKTVDDFFRARMLKVNGELLSVNGFHAAIAEFLMKDARADGKFLIARR